MSATATKNGKTKTKPAETTADDKLPTGNATPEPELKVTGQWVSDPDYDRINSARMQARNARCAWHTAQFEAKMRKKEMDGAYEALDRVLSEEFDPPPPKPQEPNLFDQKHGPTDGDDSWRDVPLSSLGLTAAIVKSLGDAGLSTVGNLSDYSEPSTSGFVKDLTDITGIGELKAETIRRALDQFWDDRAKAAEEADEEPATDDSQE